jgi:hypothetical protein
LWAITLLKTVSSILASPLGTLYLKFKYIHIQYIFMFTDFMKVQ